MTTSTTDAEAIARIIRLAIYDSSASEGPDELSRIAETYASDILSYLASRWEAQEPVAWRYRSSINGRFGKWTVQKNKPSWFKDGMSGVELEPLYAAPPSPAPAGEPTTITYTNYRGETAQRMILPKSIWFGSTEWHPEPQWFLRPLTSKRMQSATLR